MLPISHSFLKNKQLTKNIIQCNNDNIDYTFCHQIVAAQPNQKHQPTVVDQNGSDPHPKKVPKALPCAFDPKDKDTVCDIGI